ncbi:U6 snRNA phosphodiesterase Usb1 [Trametes polyzona]|nr:U6 snRNA phosphodiesterase Usb1 [Trametes polyzona]
MKRAFPLVQYASSDEERDNSSGEPAPPSPPPKKLKKLPALPAYLAPKGPVDNPALHQGRRRTTPHVDGQFAAYVYVPLLVDRKSKLYNLLLRIFAAAKSIVPIIHAIGFSPTETGSNDVPAELHISLSRPTYLRAHQRAQFKQAVQAAAKSTQKFVASFATFSELTNDERTRTFLTLEIGAGHDNFKALSDSLTPTLRAIRQKEFYQDPRFHASIAWALLDGAKAEAPDGQKTPTLAEAATETPSGEDISQTHEESFPTIPCFPDSLVPRLREEFARELTRVGVGTFEAEEVHVRIGKEVSRWRLRE